MFPGITRDLDTYPSRNLSFSEFHLSISGALTRLGFFVSQTENFLSGLQAHFTHWDCSAPSGQRNKYVEFPLWQSLLPSFYSPQKYIMYFFHLTSYKIFSLSFIFSNLIMILLAWFSLYLSWLRSLSCFNLQIYIFIKSWKNPAIYFSNVFFFSAAPFYGTLIIYLDTLCHLTGNWYSVLFFSCVCFWVSFWIISNFLIINVLSTE